MGGIFAGDYANNQMSQDYLMQRQQEYAYEMAKKQQQSVRGIADALGMQQQAVRATPPKQDPQPNPVLLLTGDDE